MTDAHTEPPPYDVVNVAGIELAAVTRAEAVAAVLALTGSDRPQLVVTPNVDHVVSFVREPQFAAVYRSAALRIADGAPVVALSRLLGTPLPERVTGVDLTIDLLAACARDGRRVAFLGGAPERLDRAMARVRTDHPDLAIVAASSPVVDVDAPTEDELAALAECREASPDLLFVFLGSPKQEQWFARRKELLPPTVVLAVGGTVDFLAGAKRRAPACVQRIGCEWLWRLALEPRRLFSRYVIRDSQFVVIAARAYVTHLRARRAASR
jgi:N-acetylglucosaminyldiphosphoundecaprenol N-acetyl-beta-D-mannosaminyltransferase